MKRKRKPPRAIRAARTALNNELRAVLEVEAKVVNHTERGDALARDHINRLRAGIEAANAALRKRGEA